MMGFSDSIGIPRLTEGKITVDFERIRIACG
jgi:hypothetical protein